VGAGVRVSNMVGKFLRLSVLVPGETSGGMSRKCQRDCPRELPEWRKSPWEVRGMFRRTSRGMFGERPDECSGERPGDVWRNIRGERPRNKECTEKNPGECSGDVWGISRETCGEMSYTMTCRMTSGYATWRTLSHGARHLQTNKYIDDSLRKQFDEQASITNTPLLVPSTVIT